MSNTLGFYGKVPAHGDFVWYGLPGAFVTPWDDWLQRQLAGAQSADPDGWLQRYLCSPIWRFLANDPSLGDMRWCGVLLPSVDTIGRYFPFTIAAALHEQGSPGELITRLDGWFERVEQLALDALSAPLGSEGVRNALVEIGPPRCTEGVTGEATAPAMLDAARWYGSTRPQGRSVEQQWLDLIVEREFKAPCFWRHVDPESGFYEQAISEGISGFDRLVTPAEAHGSAA